MVTIQRLYQEASRKLILSFVISPKNKRFCIWIMIQCTWEQINTSSGPQCSHCFILQFTYVCQSIVNLQNSFFRVIYISLKFCSLDQICILVLFNLTKSLLLETFQPFHQPEHFQWLCKFFCMFLYLLNKMVLPPSLIVCRRPQMLSSWEGQFFHHQHIPCTCFSSSLLLGLNYTTLRFTDLFHSRCQ